MTKRTFILTWCMAAVVLAACSPESGGQKKPISAASEESRSTSTAEKQESVPETGTKLEALGKKKGRTMILAFSEIGSLRASYGGSVSVEAREYWDANDPKSRGYGLRVEVKELGTYSRESASFVDYDEIDSLLEGISVISGIDASVTSFRFYQAQYESRGGLRVSVFNTRQAKHALAISSGSASAHASIEQVEAFRGLLLQARGFLNSAKARAPQ